MKLKVIDNTSTESTRGGVREGSGRKPLKDKKQGLWIYVAGSVIKKNGGTNKSKEFAQNALILNAEK